MPFSLSLSRICQSGLSSRAARSACCQGVAAELPYLWPGKLFERHRQQRPAALEFQLVEREPILLEITLQIPLDRITRAHLLELGQELVFESGLWLRAPARRSAESAFPAAASSPGRGMRTRKLRVAIVTATAVVINETRVIGPHPSRQYVHEFVKHNPIRHYFRVIS